MTKNRKIVLGFLVLALVIGVGAVSANAALTLGALTVTSDGVLTLTTTGADSTVTIGTGRLVLSPTFAGAGSRQSVEADANLSSFTGGYGAGAMGNVMGTLAAGNSIVGGLIGKYNVADGTDSDHPQAGVIGEVGEDSGNTADAAVMAVLGGDDGATLTSSAAYGVRYLNSTPGNSFAYGLDLFSTAVDSYSAVSYGNADIRLSSGAVILSGTSTNPDTDNVTCPVLGSLYLSTGAGGTTWHCTVAGVGAAATWVAI